MGYLAETISHKVGVVEALQTKNTIEELVDELKITIEENCTETCVLVGHSWGAWLSYILTVKHPQLVRKLVLVGSGPFKTKYVSNLQNTRMERMSKCQKDRLNYLISEFYKDDNGSKDSILKELGELMEVVDTYEPLKIYDREVMIKVDDNMFKNVWDEAAKLRKSGELLEMGRGIHTPVLIIHGEYDPHPIDGVIEPLEEVLQIDKVYKIKKCGHSPWKEKFAHNEFIDIILGLI